MLSPPPEQELIHNYFELKSALQNESASQMTSAHRLHGKMQELFRLVVQLLNIFTTKISLLQQQSMSQRNTSTLSCSFPKIKDICFTDEQKSFVIAKPQQKKSEALNYLSIRPPVFRELEVTALDSNVKLEMPQRIKNRLIPSPKLQSSNSRESMLSPFQTQTSNLFNSQKKFKNVFASSFQIPQKSDTSSHFPTRTNNSFQRTATKKQIKSAKTDRVEMLEQFQDIAHYVKNYLGPRLAHDENHQEAKILKKHVLFEYLKWRKQYKKKKVSIKESLIQMQLTNQIKQFFPSMNSYTKNYRGLKFIEKTEIQTTLKAFTELRAKR